MEPDPDVRSLCAEISEEVRDIAINLFIGRLSPPVFQKAVLALESAKLKRYGFRLEAEPLGDGGTHFKVIPEQTGEPCATLDFHPANRSLEIHQICG